jgi:hypothetical protein
MLGANVSLTAQVRMIAMLILLVTPYQAVVASSHMTLIPSFFNILELVQMLLW